MAQGADTILNLGAGLDTRPYRLELPGEVRFVEVDQPKILAIKEKRLGDAAPIHPVERRAVDLTDASARRALLDEVGTSSRSVVVLTEGVVPYLGLEHVGELADDLAGLAPARSWILDYYTRALLRIRAQRGIASRMQNAPFLFDPDDFFGFFEEHGWRLGELRYFMDEGRRRGRYPPMPPWRLWFLRLTAPFRSRAKREAFRTMSGYALLERTEAGGSAGG